MRKCANLMLLVSAQLVLCAPNVCATDSEGEKKIAKLPNFHEVHPFLYRGGEPTREGLTELQGLGVKTIIDLRNPGEKKFDEKTAASGLGMAYIAMPMNSEPPTRKQVDTMMDSIKAARTSPDTNGKVFVHCAHGSDRTGCMVGIWRVTVDKWTYDQAYKEMRQYWFTPKFTKLSGAVKEYAEGNLGEQTTNPGESKKR